MYMKLLFGNLSFPLVLACGISFPALASDWTKTDRGAIDKLTGLEWVTNPEWITSSNNGKVVLVEALGRCSQLGLRQPNPWEIRIAGAHGLFDQTELGLGEAKVSWTGVWSDYMKKYVNQINREDEIGHYVVYDGGDRILTEINDEALTACVPFRKNEDVERSRNSWVSSTSGVKDKKSGLEWSRYQGERNWNEASSYCISQGMRLPTDTELYRALLGEIHRVLDLDNGNYWSSNLNEDVSGRAWAVTSNNFPSRHYGNTREAAKTSIEVQELGRFVCVK